MRLVQVLLRFVFVPFAADFFPVPVAAVALVGRGTLLARLVPVADTPFPNA